MIVTCPSCSVRYLVDARALGLKGRMVRCARCAHTWHQAPSEEALAAAVPPPPPAPEPPAPPSAARRASASDDPTLRRGQPSLAAERRIQLPALPRRKRRWGLILAWTITAIAVVAGILYAAAIERSRVIGLVPGSAALYARAGFPPEPSGTGFEFRNVTTTRGMDNGLPALVVSGDVTNVSEVARDVPKLVVILRDKTEHDLQNTTVSVGIARLAPGQSVPFHATFSQPAEAAAGVFVTFAGANPG